MEFAGVKGTRDFYPQDMEERNRVFAIIKEIACRYGFKEVESPAFESLQLLTAKSGEEIKNQIFVMEKRSNEEIGLRFDLTVPLVRMFGSRQKELAKPAKWFYLTRMWRYEAPQKGRLREFYQFGVEIFGSPRIEADAECISVAIDVLRGLGLTEKDFVIKINNRMLLQGFLESIGVKDIDGSLRLIDKRDKISKEEFMREMDQGEKVEAFLTNAKLDNIKIDNENAIKAVSELNALMNFLKENKKFIEFSPKIARGLGYYTGNVFECFDRSGKLRAILGGGRYDNLVEQFGGDKCPAVGFAMGDVVLEIFLKEKGLWQKEPQGIDYFVAPVNETFIPMALEIAQKLRRKFSVDIDLMGRKLAKQMNYANSILAKKVIIVGEEIRSGKVKVKELASGSEEEVSVSSL